MTFYANIHNKYTDRFIYKHSKSFLMLSVDLQSMESKAKRLALPSLWALQLMKVTYLNIGSV